jgi:monoamine oxidase
MSVGANSTEVVVVGGGLSGLAAARRLQRAGRDLVVLEARNRIGGRVHSTRATGGTVIDLGAQWIGPGQHRMYELARDYDVAIVPTHKTGKHVFDLGRGTQTTRHEYPPLPLLSLFDAAQIGFRLERAARKTSPDQPWLARGAALHDQQSALNWIEKAAFTEMGAAFWSALAEAATCADPSRSTALDLFQQTRSLGGLAAFGTAEQDYLSSGAQALVDGMARELSRDVELGAAVRRIEHGADAVRIVTDRGTWHARRAVVALPLSVLENVMFEPALPEPRCALASLVVRADVIKSIVIYDRAYWRDSGFSGVSFSLPGPVNTMLDGGRGAAEPGILVALAAGRRALRLGAVSPEARRRAVVGHIAQCFPSMLGKVPVEYFECNWAKEEWSGGGYASRLGPGAWAQVGPALRAPIGPIHWAGTELATDWRSYMEGAVQSGERAAEEILALTET